MDLLSINYQFWSILAVFLCTFFIAPPSTKKKCITNKLRSVRTHWYHFHACVKNFFFFLQNGGSQSVIPLLEQVRSNNDAAVQCNFIFNTFFLFIDVFCLHWIVLLSFNWFHLILQDFAIFSMWLQTDGQMNQWTDRPTDGWTNGWSNGCTMFLLYTNAKGAS